MEFRDSTGKLIKTGSTPLFTTPQAEKRECPPMKYTKQANKLAKLILVEDAFQGKKAHPHCRQFRQRCWLPYPQPECQDCKYLPLEDVLRG